MEGKKNLFFFFINLVLFRYGLNMWATLVNLNGEICHIAHSGETVYDQWLGSRLISVQKAYTSNAFSLNNLGVATCNLYSPTQPGGSLFELTSSSLRKASFLFFTNLVLTPY